MLFTSRVVLPSLRTGSFTWKPHLRPLAETLRNAIEDANPQEFDNSLDRESRRRMEGFVRAVDVYHHHPYQRMLEDPPVVWRQGSSRLLDYSLPGSRGAVVLAVPSLINRAYILDLTERRSVMRYLAAKGLRPFLLDWGEPGEAESGFDLNDYIVGRLGCALDVVLVRAGRPLAMGYCMGGLLGLGLGVLRQSDLRGLALLATPWDFHLPDRGQADIINALRKPLEDVIRLNGVLPTDLLQMLFSSIDPGGCERKFHHFAALAAGSRRARDFVALEDWLNDGVPLAGKVALECLFSWYVDNAPAQGNWQLGGTVVRPEEFKKPALVLVPKKDRIVPPASAEALARALPNARLKVINAGHIGMVTGGRAQTDVYSLLTKWLDQEYRH